MVIATIFFWAGRKKFVHIPPAGLGFLKQMFSREGLGAFLTVGDRLCVRRRFSGRFGTKAAAARGRCKPNNLDLHWFGMELLASQVQTANPILILLIHSVW